MARQRAPHRVVVVGSGFGGLFATKALRRAPAEVTLIGQTTHHLFQPLLYQVATGILSPGEIAPATREVLRRQRNAEVVLGEVTGIDLEARTVTSRILDQESTHPYDSLIVAAGAGQSYFGNDSFAQFAPGMKSIDDALELRGRILGAFELAERAEREGRHEEVDRLLTFVVVGAGPTGVEMAGQIAELARRTLPGEFRHINPATARVILLDAAPAVLGAFGEKLAGRAEVQLQEIGVEVRLRAKVVDVDAQGLTIETGNGREVIPAATKVWAAGVAASPLGVQLAAQSEAGVDRAGRVQVNPDCSLPGHPEVYVVGDMMALEDLPGVAQVAIQSARHAASQIQRRIRGRETGQAFQYSDKGSMATVSRFHAVASVGRFQFSGFIAWLLWLAIHLVYIIGFKHRLTTLLHWAVSFVGRGRSERTATLQQVVARGALGQLGADPHEVASQLSGRGRTG